MENKVSKCRLCQKEKPLEVSHIIPKFVFKYHKKTSPTGNIRSTKNPNLIARDGEKLPFFCSDCEGVFSKWETRFATDIFHPYQNKLKSKFEYNDWLYKYLASVSFRVLLYVYEDCDLQYFSPKMKDHAKIAINSLRNFLNGTSEHAGEQRQLLYLLDVTKDRDTSSQKFDESLYLSRAIELDVLTTDNEACIYVKYLKFLQLCPIKLESNAGWRTGRIHHKEGILEVKSHELPGYIGNKIKESTMKLNQSRSQVSDKQASIIDKRVHSNLHKIPDIMK